MTDPETKKRNRTQKALHDSLAELLLEKPIKNIKVQELTDRAGIHRLTFYKYYQDIYDLYEQMQQNLIADMGYLMIEHNHEEGEIFYKHLIEYVDANRNVFRVLFNLNPSYQMYYHFMIALEEKGKLIWLSSQVVSDQLAHADYFVHYHTSGCMAIVARWVNSGFTESRSEIIKMLCTMDKILTQGLSEEVRKQHKQ